MNKKQKMFGIATINFCGKAAKLTTQVALVLTGVGLIASLIVDRAERREQVKKIERYNNLSSSPKNKK